jgi:pyrroline-5-carboxylate reductase
MINIGIIGLGKMAEAIAGSLAAGGRYKVYFNELDPARSKDVLKRHKELKSLKLKELLEISSLVVIAVKPQNIKELLGGIKVLSIEQRLFVSIAAGISIDFIKREGSLSKVARVMPNMAALVGESFSAVAFSEQVAVEEAELVKEVFSNIGEVREVREELFDAITAISGSGPGYFAYFIKALEEAAAEAGLAELSSVAVLESLKGTLKLLKELDISPEELILKVKSPGGTTEACLDLWQERELSKLIAEGIKRAITKSKELGR